MLLPSILLFSFFTMWMKLLILVNLASIIPAQVVKRTRCISRANIVYMIPGNTDNISAELFPEVESFLINMTNYFEIQENGFNIGLMVYGKEPIVTTKIKPFKSRQQINTRISLLSRTEEYTKQSSGPVNLAYAIQRMSQMFEFSQRKKPDFNFLLPVPVQNVAVLILNGSQKYDQHTLRAATEAKNRGIIIYVVTSGIKGEHHLPYEIATDRCKVYHVENFPINLASNAPSIGSSICEVSANNRDTKNNTRSDSANNCTSAMLFDPPPLENNIVCKSSKEELHPDIHNCVYFFKCNRGVPRRMRCTTGDVFDSYTQTCNHKEAVACYSQISCPSETGLFPYPGNCFKFLNCFRGIAYILTCPNGLLFDKVTKRCLRPGETFC